jgi:glycosyltransferase involved in cell wall biosynthesis
MSAKKVLMFGWEYPPHHSGGLGVACKGMAHALIDNDVHVCFMLPKTLAIHEPKVQLGFADKMTITTTGTTTTTTVISQLIPHLEVLARELQNPYLTSLQYEKKLQMYIKAGGKIVPRTLIQQVDHYATLVSGFSKEELDQYDVIHAHDWLCFPAGIAAKQLTGKPLIAHVHATEFDRCGGNHVNQVVYDREREGMHAADHVIAVSELTKKIVVEKYGIHPNKVTVVHNGNTPSSPHKESRFTSLRHLKESGKKIALFAGRITIQKGVDYFIHAAKKVLEYDKDVYFIVAGSGDMEEQIKHLTDHLGIRDHFLFTGYYTIDEQASLFTLADVVVMPSVSEPFGIIPLESMSNGTPVIVSKQSGVAEVITHALKVDFWDTDETANQILAILQYPVLKETLQKEGLRQVGAITWDRAAKKMKALYQTVA